jgi:hypothetical protein
MTEQQLPYSERDGTTTAGWSGSETSHERAVEERDSGRLTRRLTAVLEMARMSGVRGVTVKEVREEKNLHHGKASAVLSVLHQRGELVRLQERRDRCQVYVLPRYRLDRDESEHRRNAENQPKYPHPGLAGCIVLGPEVFVSEEGDVINYKGENYYRKPF